jgi:DNA-binding MarR family transcriptional regulator
MAASRDTAKPQGCTNFKIRQLMRQVSQHYDAELGKTGLKTTQYSLLSHVLRIGPVQPRALAQAMRMDASTLSRNMKPLVEAGWLEVLPGRDDRSRSIAITASGRAKREEAQRHWKTAQDKINRTLGNDRVLALHALIDDALALLSPEETEND